MLGTVALVELAVPILERALEAFPTAVRTLDALHLATLCFLRSQDQELLLATYDQQLMRGAQALGIPIWEEQE